MTATNDLVTYGKWSPTQFDSRGAFLDDDRQGWLVVPVMQTRDSGALDKSNFAAALEILGGEESENGVEVHRFGHWGPGWFEIILVDPKHADVVRDIQASLADYPVLNDSDFSEREFDEYLESWDSWGSRDFRRSLIRSFDHTAASETAIDDCPDDVLREFYESLIPSGEYYIGESSGVHLPIDRAVENCTRDKLTSFLRQLRKR